MFASGPDAVGPEQLDRVIVEGLEWAEADDLAEQCVGEDGIARQGGAVQIGADHPTTDHSLGAIAVALAGVDPSQCRRGRSGQGAARVVLESRQHPEFVVVLGAGQAGRSGEEFADRPRSVGADGDAVEEAESVAIITLAVGEPMAEDLHPGADGQNGGTAIDGTVQSSGSTQFVGGSNLRSVLATSDEVEVAIVGNGITCAHHVMIDAPLVVMTRTAADMDDRNEEFVVDAR